jgi:hypothetical protein
VVRALGKAALSVFRETIMAPKVAGKDTARFASLENITFIRQMLQELQKVAERENAEMLCYLIEMAYVEAGDLQSRIDDNSVGHGN